MSTGPLARTISHGHEVVIPMPEKVLKYSAVKRAIFERITSEQYPLNSMIPSEREFIESFGVSRITVRKAIDELVAEGYLYRIQGKGTYVKSDEAPHDLFSLTSCTEEIESMGMTAGRRVVRAEVVGADQRLAATMELDEGSPIFVLERVYYANGQPINYTTTHLPLALFPGLDEHDFAVDSLYSVIEHQYGVTISNARRMLEATLAEGAVAKHLDVAKGSPLILFNCQTHGEVPSPMGGTTQRLIEAFTCWYRTDVHKFYINQVR
jgi:GntR family transcriptional regulator